MFIAPVVDRASDAFLKEFNVIFSKFYYMNTEESCFFCSTPLQHLFMALKHVIMC